MFLINLLRSNRATRKVIYTLGRPILLDVFRRIKIYFRKGNKIIDIGAGTCQLDEIIRENGFNILPLDVKNMSFVDGLDPIIYDGNSIPFKNNEFDLALIFYVLHHVPDPEKLLLEAKRVSKRILIREDIYTNSLQKYLMFIVDSVMNVEFFGHPHQNRDDGQWKKTFEKLGLRLLESKIESHMFVFLKGTYLLET